MTVPVFPNGFESWQKTHFEVVEVLCYFRDLEQEKQPKSFAEMIDRSGTDSLYRIAKELTDKFESEHPSLSADTNLFDEIEDFFVSQKDAIKI